MAKQRKIAHKPVHPMDSSAQISLAPSPLSPGHTNFDSTTVNLSHHGNTVTYRFAFATLNAAINATALITCSNPLIPALRAISTKGLAYPVVNKLFSNIGSVALTFNPKAITAPV